MDSITEEGKRIEFAKVCVEMQSTSQFPEEFDLVMPNGEIFLIRVEYPWKPITCSWCKAFGHARKECILAPKESEPRKDMKKGKESHHQEWRIIKDGKVQAEESKANPRDSQPKQHSPPNKEVTSSFANKFSLLENIVDYEDEINEENIVVNDTHEDNSRPSMGKNGVSVETKERIDCGGEESSSKMVSEESSSGEPLNDSYNMNSSEEMVEMNKRALRREEKKERLRNREEIMREFLGGSPTLVEDRKSGNGSITTGHRVENSYKIEIEGGVKRGKVENDREDAEITREVECSQETLESEESSGHLASFKDYYGMNSSEERVENNRRAFREEEKREKERLREDTMRDFLGGSPKFDLMGGIKRGNDEAMEGSSEESPSNKEGSPIGLEDIESSLESPTIKPFGNLQRVDEKDFVDNMGSSLSRRKRKNLAKRARALGRTLPSHD